MCWQSPATLTHSMAARLSITTWDWALAWGIQPG